MTDRHLTDADMPLFTQLRMTAFGQTVIDLANDPACDEWTFSEKIFHALDKEITARQERRTQKLLKASRSPNPDACVEEIRYLPDLRRQPRANRTTFQLSMDRRHSQSRRARPIQRGQDLPHPGASQCRVPKVLHREVLPA